LLQVTRALNKFYCRDGSQDAADLLADEAIWAEASAPVRMLLDIALQDARIDQARHGQIALPDHGALCADLPEMHVQRN
jgi:hypothetical protein